MTRIFALIAAAFLATTASAQQFPDRTAPGVNDFANMIDSITETRIATALADIAEDHDTEVAVVTLSSLQFYANDSTIEDYSTALFNTWGLGDADNNTGILMLVFRDDREVRIENGSGYSEDANFAIQQVIQQDIIPQFRNEDFSAGIEAGISGLLTRVIDAPSAPATTVDSAPVIADGDTDAGSSNTLYYILGGVAAAIAALFGLNRRNAAKFAAQPCSNCGKTGLEKSREVLQEPTLEAAGTGENRIICPSCGHVDATPYTISKLTPEDPKRGGTSDGDGATGKW